MTGCSRQIAAVLAFLRLCTGEAEAVTAETKVYDSVAAADWSDAGRWGNSQRRAAPTQIPPAAIFSSQTCKIAEPISCIDRLIGLHMMRSRLDAPQCIGEAAVSALPAYAAAV
jgi:hypothetical protein